MSTASNVKVGGTIFLPLTTIPSDGDLATLQYKATPTGFLTLAPQTDAVTGRPTGVSVTGVKKTDSPVAVEADCQGLPAGGTAPGTVVAVCNVSVTVPLVTAMVLGPAA